MPRIVIVCALVLTLAAVGVAQAENVIGISFDPDHLQREIWVEPGAPFAAYIYLYQPDSIFIGAYEASIGFSVPGVLIVDAVGPNGWTNFGDFYNHLVGYQIPVPAPGEALVLCTLTCLLSADLLDIHVNVGPSEPSSFDPPQACYADGIDVDVLVGCETSGAMINRAIANEATSLTAVKALFR